MTEQTALCPLCCTEMQPWFNLSGDWLMPSSKGRVFEVYRCPDDGFGQVRPTPDADELARHYALDNYYTHGNTRQSDVSFGWLAQLIAKLAYRFDGESYGRKEFVEGLSRTTALDILDIGCGGGKLMRYAAEFGHHPYGIEPDPKALSHGADFPFPVRTGTAEVIPSDMADRTFDAIVMVHVMEHVTDHETVFRNLSSMLRPGGQVYIETPNCACLDFKLSRLSWPHLEVPRHLNFWTADLLSKAALTWGLKTKSTHHMGYTRQFTKDWFQDGVAMAKFHDDAPSSQRRRGLGTAYSAALLAATALLPATLKYDATGLVFEKPL